MWIILFGILFLIVVALFIFTSCDKGDRSNEVARDIDTFEDGEPSGIAFLKKKFNNTTTDLNNIGGLLANNFGMSYFEKMLEVGDVNYSDTSVCASINRKTCTAYSYIRKDLVPMLFIFPGIEANVPCGIILDPKKVWDLITLLSVVDADTNNRSCCTNENYDPILTRNPFQNDDSDQCMVNTIRAQKGPDSVWLKQKYAVYMPLGDPNFGAGCPRSCNGDLNCMYANTGGNINQYLMNASPECKAGNYASCFNFTEVPIDQVPQKIKDMFKDPNAQPDGYLELSFAKDCPTCKKPYLCVFENSPNNKFETIYEPDRIASYIGKDGLGFQNLFGQYMDIVLLQILQCRVEKKDWNLWVKLVKDWYKTLMSIMTKDNGMPDRYSYMLANPNTQGYFENEINLYINPDTSSREYKRQNKIFQDSIIGFYYNATTCEEQLNTLNGIKSVSQYNSSDVFYNNVDRCDRYWWLNDNSFDTNKRRSWEIDNIEKSRELVRKVADMFNKKHNRNVPVLKNVSSSNAYPNYNDMQRALNGKIQFNDVFIPDDN
jgi:hypothetical protein